MKAFFFRQREPWFVAGAVVAVVLLRSLLPEKIELGSLLALGALALLGQGFIRDLNRLLRQRARLHPSPAEALPCICLESAIGLPLILAGVALVAGGLGGRVLVKSWEWPAFAATIWSGGFLMRDIVFMWRPWGFRRITNHGSILVQWRRP